MNFPRKIWFFLLTFLAVSALQPAWIQAATFCVNEQADDGTGNAGDCPNAACDGTAGTCSLRDAVENANLNADSDTITFSSTITSPLTIVAGDSFGLPTIFFPVAIVGPGADALTVSIDGGSNTVFWFDAEEQPRSYSVSGMTITQVGNSGFFADKIIQHRGTLTISDSVITGRGRGISSFGEELTINNSTISGNVTAPGDDGTGAGMNFGGGVDNGILTINNSTFSNNQKLNTSGIDIDEGGGAIGIFDGSSLFEGTDFTVTLTNVTISGNRTNENGGGIWISDDCTECTFDAVIHATLTNVTIADNDADVNGDGGDGGGIFVSLSNSGASVTLNNALIADNETGGPGASDCSVSGINLSSNGFNLVTDPTDCAGLSGSDITNQDPLLAALALNPPGTTETQALDSNSPAINAGDDADCPSTDQRGVPRPQGSACDIGAYEAVICGDGTVGPGEECEPGSGCCTDECLFADAGTSCDDGDSGTIDDECTSTGVCEGIPDNDGDLDGGGCSLSPRSSSHWSLSPMLATALGLALFRRRLRQD